MAETKLQDLLGSYRDGADAGQLREGREYSAVIVDAMFGESSNGNPMVTIEFRLDEDGHKVRGHYVLNFPTGAGKFASLVQLTGRDPSRISDPAELVGSRVTVTLKAYTNRKGGESHSVDRVTA